ncbi:serine/threonine-protein kinase [Streptomyces sp. G45]|uniref:serine/threonine-protein kinase n=1 Tax=Streptomyces sp. G45 TaxID=3406627 RepID=UPI003C1ADF6F
MLHLPLHRDFRYIHEPLPVGDGAIPVLGHEELVDALRERLTYSHGGTFLVTGFRGVGKSTLVLRALARAAAEQRRGEALLPVHLNVARRMEPDQLLFAVVRRIFETLDDRGLFARLPAEVREALLLAYTRTSLSFTQTHAEGSEYGAALGFGMQKGGPLASLTPSLSMTGKKVSGRAMEASFLAYSETDVEHDLVRIIQLLGDVDGTRPPPRRLLRRRRRSRLRIHPVIVLDEVDKLTDNSTDAIADLEKLLGTLKNVLTARGAHFIVVAGPDLHDQVLKDADRGGGLYESVFAWRMYVPCLWAAPERLVTGLSALGRAEQGLAPLPMPSAQWLLTRTWDGQASLSEVMALTSLITHLQFKARGVPRRLLQEFNSLVTWDETGRPALRVTGDDWQRVQFYSHLEAVVTEAVSANTTSGLATVPIDIDRWRLGGYHLVDWTLRSRGRVFTAADITGDGQVDPLLRMDSPTAERLLRHLAQSGVVEVVSEGGRPDATVYGNPADAAITYYKLTEGYARRLAGFARHSESERADLGLPAPPARSVWDDTLSPPTVTTTGAATGQVARVEPEPPVMLLADRYELRQLIGQGGMGSVYRGRDLRTGEEVAVKLVHRVAAQDPAMRARFAREAQIGLRMRHPNVARGIAVVEHPEPALVMELVEGPSLYDLLQEGRLPPPRDLASLAENLGEALSYLHAQGLSRIDLKPSNVIVHPARGAVIIDLGVARTLDSAMTQLTDTGIVIGTPVYMAPEQALGADVDIRSDLYALGVMLYECAAGRRPHADGELVRVMYTIVHQDVDVSSLGISPELRQVLSTCLARDPEDRYQDPAAFLAALRATPEALGPPSTGFHPLADTG